MFNFRFFVLASYLMFVSFLDAQSVDDHVLKLAQSNNTFAIELYRNLSEGHDNNLCLSPYSISSALAMVYNGAEAETKKEIGNLLGFSQFDESMNSDFAWMNQYLNAKSENKQPDFSIYVANSLWVQSGFPLLPKFLESMEKYYASSLQRVDFIQQPEKSRLGINNWIKDKTAGKIENLIAPDDLTDTTRMVLASAIYMKAAWAKVFNEKATKEEPFFVSKEESKQVPMMSNTEKFSYFEDEQFALLQLPYVNLQKSDPELAMLIFLPKENDRIVDLEKQLSADFLQKWVSSLKSERVEVSFPRFKILDRFDLSDVLRAMGMPIAFSNRADFSGMTGTQDLKIGKVLHKAFIDVKEQGTEAAAATAVIMQLKSAPPGKQSKPIIFKVDHPFVYLIHEKKTGAILFIGRVVDPTMKE